MSIPGPNVFGDRRLGVWNISPANLPDRLPKFRAYGITDVFLPRTATTVDVKRVRDAGYFVGLWEAVNGRTAGAMAIAVVADLRRLGVGPADLNVELPTDAALEPYMRALVSSIRAPMPSRRLRLNVAWRKGGFLPVDLLASDPNLYACEQGYFGDMELASPADALEDLLDAGVPMGKAAVCYGAAGLSAGRSSSTETRVGLLPVWAPRRGVVFQDDLMAEAGML